MGGLQSREAEFSGEQRPLGEARGTGPGKEDFQESRTDPLLYSLPRAHPDLLGYIEQLFISNNPIILGELLSSFNLECV